MTLEEGQILFREGDPGENLYVVRDGELQGKSTLGTAINTYGPGALIGELAFLKKEPYTETITATEDCELIEITPDALEESLEQEPAWFRSIITFLTGRLQIAGDNKRKSDKIKALPSLLYILDSLLTHVKASEEPNVSHTEVIDGVEKLFNLSKDNIEDLLKILEDLEVLKIQGEEIHVKNANVIHLLYETIRFRARYKKTPPQILSMTEQMVLNAVIKTVQQSKEPLKNGAFTVKTESLLKVGKRAMFGATLTLRTMLPLLERKLLNTATPLGDGSVLPEIEAIPFFYGDFDTILDLMELNRIYPLLDKKLVK